jgi:site-specific recombinase XerD
MDIIPRIPTAQVSTFVDSTPHQEVMSLDQCLTAWLHEKYEASHSEKTRHEYSTMLAQFREALHASGHDLDADPRAVALAAQGWAAQSRSPRRAEVSWSTFNQRLAILSSFYEYAIRFEVLTANPIERVKRRKKGAKEMAPHLAPATVKKGLQQIDRSTPEGLRDYALLSIALATGRRASELAGLRYKHLRKQGSVSHVEWERCKGGKQLHDVLPEKTTQALYTYLQAVYGTKLGTLSGDAPVWVSCSLRNAGQAIGTRTISNICEAYLGTSKVHATRHTWAMTMMKKGASLQQIGKGLGHSNLKTTSDYLEDLAAYENPYAASLEDEWGI